MPQISVSQNPGIGFAGQIAEPMPRAARSMSCEVAGLVSGQIVVRGTDPYNQVNAVPTSAFTPDPSKIAGVIIFSSSKPFNSGAFSAGDKVDVMRLGSIYMQFSAAVTAGQMVGYKLSDGTLTGIAQGTAAGSITTGIVVIPGLRIASTTTAAGVAIVEVNLFGSQDLSTVGSG